MRRSNRSAFALTLLVCVMLAFAAASWLANEAPLDSPRLNYWLSVFAGNFSPASTQPIAGFGGLWEYWLGVLLAVGLNLGPVLAFIALLGSLNFVKRTYAMTYLQAVKLLTAEIQDAVLHSLSDADYRRLRPDIKSAVETGVQTWRDKSLVTLLGKRGAAQLLKELEEENLEEAE